MSIRSKRVFLLSSSALVLLTLAGATLAQTPTTTPETPPATPEPAPQPPQQQAPAPQSQPAPSSPPAETTPATPAPAPGAGPAVPVPQVTVEAPPTPRRRAAPAAPAATRGPAATPARRAPRSAPPITTTRQPTAPSTPSTTIQAPTTYAPLSTIAGEQIQASESKSIGGLLFTTPGATSAGLAPGTQRPILRGLEDFRVRVQENGIGSMDMSDYGQDHGVPIDPLSVQKVEIYRGPEALRYGSQAVGGVVEATNNRIPFAAPVGGWQMQFQGATTTVDRGVEGGAMLDAGNKDVAIHADVYGRHAGDYYIPSYPYLFPEQPALPFNGKQPNSSMHAEGEAVGGSYLFDGGYVGAAVSHFSTLYHVPTMEGAATNTRIALEQVRYTGRGEFRPQSSAIDVVRFWLGAVEYRHDEIGFGDNGDGIQATFNNHAQEAKTEVKFLPLFTPIGKLISTVGTQFDHQQIDTSGDAGSLLGQARTNRTAAYSFNELWFTDNLRALLAARIEDVRLDGTPGIFPESLLPPPDEPTLVGNSLRFTPKSISFSLIQDLPSWMIASLNLQRIQRAPTALELFAHGAHDAPGTFEIGNPNLKIETANSGEIGLKRIQGEFRFDAKAYYTYYNNFIFRRVTGIMCGTTFDTCGVESELIQTVYGQHDAIFRGVELAWQWDVIPLANGIFGVDGQYDWVRATFTDGGNIPRMPPMRVGGGAYWRKDDNWFVRMGLIHAFGQKDLGVNETPTAGYNLLKLEISNRRFYEYSPWGPTEITTGLVGDNLLDIDIRNHVQFHKDEILWPGRSVKLFMNAKFGGVPVASKAPAGYYYKAPGLFAAPLFKAPVFTVWSWAGPYIGGNFGYSAGKSKTTAAFSDPTGPVLFAAGSTEHLSGLIGGIQGGYNWQWGNLVAGIEADFEISGEGATPRHLCPGAICNPTISGFDAPVLASFDQGPKLDSFGTVRGRFGTTVTPEVMVYGTGGLAVGSIRSTGTLSGTGLDGGGNLLPVSNAASVLTHRIGWTAGGGLEGRLFGNVTGKLEYLYMDFGTVSAMVTNPLNATPVTFSSNSHVTDNIVRAGLNYKFDPAVGGYEAFANAAAPIISKGLPLKAPFRAPVAVAWTWAGPYLGTNIGYSMGKTRTDVVFSDMVAGTPLFASSASNDNLKGVIGGLQGGYNWLVGPWLVAGLESDIQLSAQKANPEFGCPTALCNAAVVGFDAPVTAAFDRGQTLDWFATVRGRLGATVTPDVMAYVTGGLAVGEIKSAGTISGFSPGVDDGGNSTVTPVNVNFYNHKVKAGVALGAGVEAHLGGNLTGKVEYLYLDFGSVSLTANNPFNGTPIAVAFNSRVTDNIVRLGINYQFARGPWAYQAPARINAPMLFKAPIVSAWTWAGFYLGFNVGYSFGRSNTDIAFSDAFSGAALFADRSSSKLDGGIFGAQAGYNWLAGNWLVGIEGDLQYADQRANLTSFCSGAICNPALIGVVSDPSVLVDFEHGQRLEWFGTLRGRFGTTVTPEAIAYVTGGLAVGEMMTAGTIYGFDAAGNYINSGIGIHRTRAGWTAGGGLEGHLIDNWTGKIEYLHLDFGSFTVTPGLESNATVAATFTPRIIDNLLRVGINYKFDPRFAVVANY
jgi:iron complex outermembrane receptor protein